MPPTKAGTLCPLCGNPMMTSERIRVCHGFTRSVFGRDVPYRAHERCAVGMSNFDISWFAQFAGMPASARAAAKEGGRRLKKRRR